MPVRAASFRRSRWVILSGLLLCTIAAVAVPLVTAQTAVMPSASAPIKVAPSSAVAATRGNQAAPASSTTAKPEEKPFWADLTDAQKNALAPLATEWSKIDLFRKKKWIEVASRYAALKPAEQQRLQVRMREWAKLSPEQRRVAREMYTRTKTLAPNEKSAQWLEYQQLPDAEKRRLATAAAGKKRVANLPPPVLVHGSPNSVSPASVLPVAKPATSKAPLALPPPLPTAPPPLPTAPVETTVPAVAPLPQPIPMIN